MEADTKKDNPVDANPVEESSVASVGVEISHSAYSDFDGDEAPKQQVSDIDKRVTRLEPVGYGLTVVIALAAVVSALVAGLQWHTMNRQLVEMRDNSIQADKLLKSTEQLARSAVDALALNRGQFIQANRPYIVPMMQPSPGLVGEPVQATMTLINYGKTVALNTVARGAVFIGPKATEEANAWFVPFDIQKSESYAGPPIPPGVPNEVQAVIV